MGRPKKYPDSLEVAMSFRKSDSCFHPNWYVQETERSFILHGKYRIRQKFQKIKLIPFMIYVPKFSNNPRAEAKLKFNHTNEVKHALAEHNLRARLEGYYLEEFTAK